MKRKIICVILVLIMLFGISAIQVEASGIGYVPVNTESWVYQEDDMTYFYLFITNTTDKTIVTMDVVWYPRDVWGAPVYDDGQSYFNGYLNEYMYLGPGESTTLYWETSYWPYSRTFSDTTTAVVKRAKFTDGTIWQNNGYNYQEANFKITNQQLSDGSYLVDPYDPYIYVESTGYSVNARSWYVWNDGEGWVWFSNETYASCYRSGKSGAIKLVINNNPNLYKIINFNISRSPVFLSTVYGTDWQGVECGGWDSYIRTPNDNLPFRIGLWDLADDVYARSWYIWNDNAGWVLFSNERGPICELWRPGSHSIKLVYNNNPEQYTIWTVTIGSTVEQYDI